MYIYINERSLVDVSEAHGTLSVAIRGFSRLWIVGSLASCSCKVSVRDLWMFAFGISGTSYFGMCVFYLFVCLFVYVCDC